MSTSQPNSLPDGGMESPSLPVRPEGHSFRFAALPSFLAGVGITAISLIGTVLFALSVRATSAAAGIDTPFLSQAVTIGATGLILGWILVAEGWRLWRGTPPAPFLPQRLWPLWLAFFVLWILGTVLSLSENAPPYLTAPVQALTLLLLSALVLSAVGWTLRGRGGSWSDVGRGLVSGAVLGTGAAAVLEITLLAILVILLLVGGALPREWLQQDPQALISGDSPLFTEMDALLELLTPTVVLIGLAFIGGVVPLVEEVTKTLGVGLAGLWLRPSPARAFLLGVASGAGFALAENALNTTYGPVWGIGVGTRLAATVMHCATGGLMGWGWGQWWAGRRPWRFPLAWAAAVILHGVWNTIAVGIALSSLMTIAQADRPVWIALGGLTAMALGALELILAVAVTAALLWAGYRLGQRG